MKLWKSHCWLSALCNVTVFGTEANLWKPFDTYWSLMLCVIEINISNYTTWSIFWVLGKKVWTEDVWIWRIKIWTQKSTVAVVVVSLGYRSGINDSYSGYQMFLLYKECKKTHKHICMMLSQSNIMTLLWLTVLLYVLPLWFSAVKKSRRVCKML